jgi:hypothetical protein
MIPKSKKDDDDCSFQKKEILENCIKKHKHVCKLHRAQHEHSVIINPTYSLHV